MQRAGSGQVTGPVLRFAPSPTGRLHLGHALSALLNLAMARRLGGRLLIRIENIDKARCRPQYEAAILDDLAWLGVHSEGPVLRQSEHRMDYATAIDRLQTLGLLYPCFATRQQIQAAARPGARDPDGAPLYPDLCKHWNKDEVAARMAAGVPFALRLDMAKAVAQAEAQLGAARLGYATVNERLEQAWTGCAPQLWGDIVIRRKDGSASYHVAVVVDDARQGISHVVRGRDLQAATDVHRVLHVLLGLPAPRYCHHRLILASGGQKLSKRNGDTSLETLRAGGATVEDVRRLVGLRDVPEH